MYSFFNFFLNSLTFFSLIKIFFFIILGQTQNDGDAFLYSSNLYWTLLGLLLSKAIYSCWIIISIRSHYHMLKLFPIFIWNLLGLLLSKVIYSCWIMISITSHYHMLRCFFLSISSTLNLALKSVFITRYRKFWWGFILYLSL